MWPQLEQKIHEYFYTGDTELRLSHLTSVKQKHNESVAEYIRRFRDTRNRYFNLTISDRNFADLAFSGLLSHLKEKLENHDFLDVSQVLQKALAQESLAKESRNFHRSNDRVREDCPNVHMLEYEFENRMVVMLMYVWPNGLGLLCLNHSFILLLSRCLRRIGKKRLNLFLM